jgi:hypothetical protein
VFALTVRSSIGSTLLRQRFETLLETVAIQNPLTQSLPLTKYVQLFAWKIRLLTATFYLYYFSTDIMEIVGTFTRMSIKYELYVHISQNIRLPWTYKCDKKIRSFAFIINIHQYEFCRFGWLKV